MLTKEGVPSNIIVMLTTWFAAIVSTLKLTIYSLKPFYVTVNPTVIFKKAKLSN